MDDIESIPCFISVLQNGWVKFKYNLCVSVIQNVWVTLSLLNVLVLNKWTSEIGSIQKLLDTLSQTLEQIDQRPP